MTVIEKLPLWEDARCSACGCRGAHYCTGGQEGSSGWSKGAILRDQALAQSARGREDRIEQVRSFLALGRDHEAIGPCLTADDVHEAADALGFGEGDTRWLANVLRSWKVNGVPVVVPTEQFVPCRRPSRSAAPTRVWRWV